MSKKDGPRFIVNLFLLFNLSKPFLSMSMSTVHHTEEQHHGDLPTMTRDEVTTAESQATHNCHDEITTKSRQSHNSGGHNSGGHNSGGHNSGHNSGHNREESEVTYEDSTSEVQPPPPPPTPPPPPLTPTMKRATTPRLSVVSVEAGGIGTISKTDDKSDKQCCFRDGLLLGN